MKKTKTLLLSLLTIMFLSLGLNINQIINKVSASAVETERVWFSNSGHTEWSTHDATNSIHFSSSDETTTWPGVPLKQDSKNKDSSGENLLYYDVPKDTDTVVLARAHPEYQKSTNYTVTLIGKFQAYNNVSDWVETSFLHLQKHGNIHYIDLVLKDWDQFKIKAIDADGGYNTVNIGYNEVKDQGSHDVYDERGDIRIGRGGQDRYRVIVAYGKAQITWIGGSGNPSYNDAKTHVINNFATFNGYGYWGYKTIDLKPNLSGSSKLNFNTQYYSLSGNNDTVTGTWNNFVPVTTDAVQSFVNKLDNNLNGDLNVCDPDDFQLLLDEYNALPTFERNMFDNMDVGDGVKGIQRIEYLNMVKENAIANQSISLVMESKNINTTLIISMLGLITLGGYYLLSRKKKIA